MQKYVKKNHTLIVFMIFRSIQKVAIPLIKFNTTIISLIPCNMCTTWHSHMSLRDNMQTQVRCQLALIK